MKFTVQAPPSLRGLRVQPLSATVLLALATLSGCSTVGDIMAGDKVDYKSGASKSATPLDVPPDLTQLSRDTNRAGSSGSGSGSSVTASSLPATPPPLATPAVAAPPANSAAGLRIERAGEQRWLTTPISPEQLWPQVQTFWKERGFNLDTEQPELGLMETEWAENRAKLPQDVIRRTLGRVIDSVYSTGERDKFRTRIERTATGGSEVYISHRGMIEVYANSKADNTVWQPRPIDPQLEALFLQRLMMKLGATEDQSKAAVVNAPLPPARSRLINQQGVVAMQLDDNFDRAWRRIGLSLDRTGFTVEDRDRTKGTYFVRYVDPAQFAKEQPGLLSRMFSKDKNATNVAKYRVLIKSDGERSVASVLNADGSPENGDNARRILGLLVDDLK
ncbi:MAG: outer membrane protein assembly factor BamC [Pseudomonadota bacterium]